MKRLRRLAGVVACALMAIAGVGQDAAETDVSDVMPELLEALQRGLYDDVISEATKHITKAEKAGEPVSPQFLYARGYAASRIAWYGVTEADMAKIGDFAPGPGWKPASEWVAKVRLLKELAPPNVHEIDDGKDVIFRVYYEEESEWADTVIYTLPEAYRAVCELYGATLAETTVFMFGDGARFNEFYQAENDGAVPTSWGWAAGGNGLLYFCERDADGSRLAEPGSEYFRGAVAHEFSHCMLARYMGAVRLPLWLNEGLAMWCGGLLAPDDFAQNDVRIAQVLAQERELSAPELVTHDEFYAEDQASTAYVQGFAMTRYLESEIGMQGILQLLTLAREKGDFDEAFSEGLGVDYYTFYRMWLDASVGMVETGGFNTR